ncbi:MAG: 23S rRNA (guanosine(2251)-2'-O)-methyltransferase RlmB [Myxococcales bacterium]|nr:23S rRNA (guanosine(2251)-2'-O)-methyltransferase RlmB [Myxococcales bacterium]
MSELVPVPGVRAVQAILDHAPARIRQVLLHGRPGGQRKAVVDALEARGVSLIPAAQGRLDQLAGEVAHQGIIALVEPASLVEWPTLFTPDALILALDQVTDPRNFGAMLRSLEALGGTGALITRDRCARPGPAVTKTSAGAAEIVPIAMETNLARALRAAQGAGLQVVVADLDGEAPDAIDWTRPTVLVMGAEGEGVRRLTRETADHIVTIGLHGATASLNVGVAAGILLHAASAARSRRA